MILPKLISHKYIIFWVGMSLLLLSLMVGCNRVILVQEGQSVQLLEDVNNVRVAVLVDKKVIRTGKADLKAGGFYVILPAEEIIDGD